MQQFLVSDKSEKEIVIECEAVDLLAISREVSYIE